MRRYIPAGKLPTVISDEFSAAACTFVGVIAVDPFTRFAAAYFRGGRKAFARDRAGKPDRTGGEDALSDDLHRKRPCGRFLPAEPFWRQLQRL